MATSLFKPVRPFSLPTNAEIVQFEGKRHFQTTDGRKTVRYPLSADGKNYLKPGKKWAADVRFADGTRKRVRFSPNRDAAAQMLNELLKRIENEKAGVADRTAKHRKCPLTDHLDDWAVSLRANNRDSAYVTMKVNRVRSVLTACGWVFPFDLSPDGLELFLADLRSRRPELPPLPTGESFKLQQVAEALGGVSRQSVAELVRKHRLEVYGHGRKRRFPRSTVEFLRGLKLRGRCTQTSNHYLQAMRQFARWLADNGRIDRCPFARVKPLNVNVDLRRRRGELSPSERTALFAAAAASEGSVRGLVGANRVMLYRVAIGTGFRASELASLVPEFFELSEEPPAIVLPAEYTKNRKGAVQPISSVLAADLRTFLADRPAKQPIWPGGWVRKAAEMLRVDLATAGVPVEVDSPEGVETRDFHALRAVFISDVIRAGADLKQAMTLARHTDPRLTAGRYARTRLHDLGSVVNKLSQQSTIPAENVRLRLTGTDDVPVTARSGAAPGAAANGDVRLRAVIPEEVGELSDLQQGGLQALDESRLGECRGGLSEEEERGLARIRTGGDGFANRCLTTWRRGRKLSGLGNGIVGGDSGNLPDPDLPAPDYRLARTETSAPSGVRGRRGHFNGVFVLASNFKTCTWLCWPTAQTSFLAGSYISPIELLNKPALPTGSSPAKLSVTHWFAAQSKASQRHESPSFTRPPINTKSASEM
jgi:excisionase family DNA binding protein